MEVKLLPLVIHHEDSWITCVEQCVVRFNRSGFVQVLVIVPSQQKRVWIIYNRSAAPINICACSEVNYLSTRELRSLSFSAQY